MSASSRGISLTICSYQPLATNSSSWTSQTSDPLSHHSLLHCMTLLGLVFTPLPCFSSCLSGQLQLVRVPNPSTVNSGVPQGSVPGPLLFIIYLLPLDNNMIRSPPPGQLPCFLPLPCLTVSVTLKLVSHNFLKHCCDKTEILNWHQCSPKPTASTYTLMVPPTRLSV